MDDTARTSGGKLGEYAYAGRPDKSMGDLVRDIISNVQEMVRSEVRLAKAEVKEEAGKSIAGAKKLGIAAVAGLFALGFVLAAVAQVLALIMPAWLATLAVGLLLGIVAAVLFSKARTEIRVPTPDKTIDNVKENVQWMKNQTKS